MPGMRVDAGEHERVDCVLGEPACRSEDRTKLAAKLSHNQRSAQKRWQTCCCVEQFAWHWNGLVVVPTIVIEGMTVVPLMVLMQVFWQFAA